MPRAPKPDAHVDLLQQDLKLKFMRIGQSENGTFWVHQMFCKSEHIQPSCHWPPPPSGILFLDYNEKFTWMYHLTKYLYFHKLDTPQNMHYFQKKAITVLQKKKMTGYEADQSTMLFHVVIVWELELFPDLEFGGCLLPQCCPKWKDLSSLAPIIMVILFAAMSHRSSSCGRGGTLLGSSVAQRTAYSDYKAHPCLSWELRGLNFGLLFPLGRATWQITTYAT